MTTLTTILGLVPMAFFPGEGSELVAPPYIAAAAKFCAERDILLMFDEIQCGVGRTGTFLACEAYGVKADLITLAKGLSGGVPVGAVLAGEKAQDVFGVSDHGSTFGGNPLAAAAGLVVLETVQAPHFLSELVRKGERFRKVLTSWQHPKIREIRGQGLMIGVDITTEAWPVLERALAAGLLILSAGTHTLRFLPPYTITDAEIDQGLALLKGILDKS